MAAFPPYLTLPLMQKKADMRETEPVSSEACTDQAHLDRQAQCLLRHAIAPTATLRISVQCNHGQYSHGKAY